MNIALIGYGKMGKAIEQIALQRKHTIGLIIDMHNQNDCNAEKLQSIDLAIEFTNPEVAPHNVKQLLSFNIPVVCGSTGWQNELPVIEQFCKEKNGSLIVSSNFSLGVNLFFALNTYLAKMMDNFKDYQISLEEIHHTQKKDAPSGTAISLAQQILQQRNDKTNWVNHPTNNNNELGITSKRIDDVFGIHTINYKNDIDEIEITHTAFHRMGFALGVILAAEYIVDKKGIHTMQEVLNISF